MISIDSNVSKVLAAAAGSTTRTLNRAFAHSANSAILQTRTFILKAFVEQGIKRKYASAAIYNVKATPDSLSASLRDGGRRIPLSAFAPRSKNVKTERGLRKGVTVAQDGARELVPGGFLVTTASGRVGIFQRTGVGRFPIQQLYLPGSWFNIFRKTQGLEAAANAFAIDAFNRIFPKDFEFYRAKEQGS